MATTQELWGQLEIGSGNVSTDWIHMGGSTTLVVNWTTTGDQILVEGSDDASTVKFTLGLDFDQYNPHLQVFQSVRVAWPYVRIRSTYSGATRYVAWRVAQ